MAQPLVKNVAGQICARLRVGSGVGDFTFSEPSSVKKHIGLERLCTRMAFDARQAHLVRARLNNVSFRDIGHNIRRDVGSWIVNLVEKLL